jgi:hypothetical protein
MILKVRLWRFKGGQYRGALAATSVKEFITRVNDKVLKLHDWVVRGSALFL